MYVPDMLEFMASLRESGLLGPVRNVLEIGAQEVFAAGFESSVERFLRAFHPNFNVPPEALTALSHGLARELFQAAGCNYSCADVIADAENRTARVLFDVNSDSPPQVSCGVFDLVTNLGVTHHAIDQLRAFNSIHDFTAVGGRMLHYLPFVGRYDNLYFYHQPAFYEQLAQANGYRQLGLWLYLSGDHLSPRSLVPWTDELWASLRWPLHLHNRYHVLVSLAEKQADAPFRVPSPLFSGGRLSGLSPDHPGLRDLARRLAGKVPGPLRALCLEQTTDGRREAPARPLPEGWQEQRLGLAGGRIVGPGQGGCGAVLNLGLSANLLDQAGLFRAAHELVGQGGRMVHVVPVLGYDRRSLLACDVSFFEELAAANEYALEEVLLLLPGGAVPLQEDLFDQLRVAPEMHYDPIWALVQLRKRHDREFCLPFQGFYRSFRDEAVARRYRVVRGGKMMPDDLEPWVGRCDRVEAQQRSLRDVVRPPELCRPENAARRAAVLRALTGRDSN